MAYKVHVKKLSFYEKELKQARHERRMAKKLLAELPQFPTAEQIEEMGNAALTNLNTHVGSILKTDYPEACELMERDWFETAKRFHDAQMYDTLGVVVEQCEEALEAVLGVSLLSLAVEPERAESANESAKSAGVTA